MCKCTPGIRTPFCGKPGCEWPPQKLEQSDQPLTVGSSDGLGVLVCEVGGLPYYGSELEASAARLEPGEAVRFLGVDDEVSIVWFYEGPVVNLKSGRKVFPALGQVFELLTPNVGDERRR
jgi:hypothetical protein